MSRNMWVWAFIIWTIVGGKKTKQNEEIISNHVMFSMSISSDTRGKRKPVHVKVGGFLVTADLEFKNPPKTTRLTRCLCGNSLKSLCGLGLCPWLIQAVAFQECRAGPCCLSLCVLDKKSFTSTMASPEYFLCLSFSPSLPLSLSRAHTQTQALGCARYTFIFCNLFKTCR